MRVLNTIFEIVGFSADYFIDPKDPRKGEESQALATSEKNNINAKKRKA